MKIDRKHLAEIAKDSLQIMQRGYYQIHDKKIFIGDKLQKAIDGTISYPPEHEPDNLPFGEINTRIEVVNETTLAVAERLTEEKYRSAALNFASAKNPGGGFRSGARAQEESLARSSGLYKCIVNSEMYPFHKKRNDPMYTNYAVYSPDVPVFKKDDGTLLEKPYLCSFITAPAVNAGAVRKHRSVRRAEIRNAMHERVLKVLYIAAIHKYDALVLGAWGCGVFKNDAREVAELFHEGLNQYYKGVFAKVVFAIIDRSKDKRFIGPFFEIF